MSKQKKILFQIFEFKNLKDVMANLVPVEQKRVSEFRKQHGAFKIGDVTVDMVIKTILKADKH